MSRNFITSPEKKKRMAQWEWIFLQYRRLESDPWIGKIPWKKKWQPTPVLLPRESHGQRSLAGYDSLGHKWVGQDWATKQQHVLQLYIRHECFSYTKCPVCSDPHTSSLKPLELHNCCSRDLRCSSLLPYAPVSSDKSLVILQNPANALYSVFETFSSSSKESGPSVL